LLYIFFNFSLKLSGRRSPPFLLQADKFRKAQCYSTRIW